VEGATIRGNKCLNQVSVLPPSPAPACIFLQFGHNALVAENECRGVSTSGANRFGIHVNLSDQVTVANNRVDAGGRAGTIGLNVVDAAHVTVHGNMVTGTGAGGAGIQVDASSAGSTDQVTLAGNQAFGNSLNYFYNAPNVTNLARSGNLNDDLSVVGGSGSRILDTFAGVASITLNPGTNNFVDVPWPVNNLPVNYAPTCTVEESTASTATLRVHHIESLGAASVRVRVVNDATSGSALTGRVHCVAVFRQGS